MHRFTQHLPVEVISDPINDMDADPYKDGVETHRNLRGHQVILQFFFSLYNILMHKYTAMILFTILAMLIKLKARFLL